MKFYDFMKMYDDWNGITRVNDANLKTIVEEKTYVIMDTRADLWSRKVIAFGFYEGVMTVRVV